MTTMTELVHRIEQDDALDRVANPISKVVGRLVRPRPVRNLLSGTWVGHPLHPMLSDLPIGAWSMAALLDALDVRAADVLVSAGIAAAVPTAAAGLNDWSDTDGETTRLGVVHAAANTTALSLHVASLVARRRGHRRLGKALSLTGCAALLAGGYLGGHLTFVKAVGVNHTAWPAGPDTWTPVIAEADLAANTPRRVDAGGAPVLLYRRVVADLDHVVDPEDGSPSSSGHGVAGRRHGGDLHAIAATCSHAGGPLDEGRIADGCVTCPWHGSTFRLADGSVVRGPATVAQPSYDTRIHEGRVEVRART